MTIAPLATHFDFTKLPFSKNVSAKDLLDRASHQEAVARIRFCIAEALLGVITGEVGVGKTVAIRAAISQLDQAAHHIVYLANPTVGTRGLYVNIVQALGAMPRGFRAELVAQTQSLLPEDCLSDVGRETKEARAHPTQMLVRGSAERFSATLRC